MGGFEARSGRLVRIRHPRQGGVDHSQGRGVGGRVEEDQWYE